MPSITKQLFLAEESKEEFHLPRQHIACHQFYALILWNYWIPSEGGIELWWSYLWDHLHWRSIWRRGLLSLGNGHCFYRWNWPIVLMRNFQSWRLTSTRRTPRWSLCQWEIGWYHYSIALSICLDLVYERKKKLKLAKWRSVYSKALQRNLKGKCLSNGTEMNEEYIPEGWKGPREMSEGACQS